MEPAGTILIADYPVGHSTGFGETLRNLLRGFPEELFWNCHPSRYADGSVTQFGRNMPVETPRIPEWVPRSMRLFYQPMLKLLQEKSLCRAVCQVVQHVRSHGIKHLLCVPVSISMLRLAHGVLRRLPELKLTLYVMDDWRGHHESNRLPFTSSRARLLSSMVGRSSSRFAVSREMAACYQREFNCAWQVAHNGVEIAGIASESKPENTPGQSVLLAGDVNVFRFDAVLAFARALERHNQAHKSSLSLTIHGSLAEECRLPLQECSSVRLPGRVSRMDCMKAIAQADWLYLPLAFAGNARRISLYSLPTKLPEYLASGNRILFHAPPSSAVIQLAERHALRPRIATVNPAELDAFVRRWVAGHEPASTCSDAHAALRAEFDIAALSSRFQSAFTH